MNFANHWNRLPAVWRTTAVLLLLLWASFLATLSPDWNLYPQYGYGWFVLPLAGFLFWRRWEERPVPQSPQFPKFWLFVGIGALIGLFIGRLCNSANGDWRLAKALASLSVVTLTLVVVNCAGGRPWLRHFAFPVLFAMTALPWSKPFEDYLTNRMMPLVAALSVDFLWLIKIPALRQGHLIQIPTGTLGVDEACSGIRSLQSTLMAALFLGEYLRLNSFRRLIMVVVGVAIAFACNVTRALILAWIGAKQGIAAVDSWHDSAGISILVVCVAGLWVLGVVLLRHQHRRKARRDAEYTLTTGMPLPASDPRAGAAFPALLPPSKWIMGCLIGFLCLEAARETWFRVHEAGKTYHRLWTADWSRLGPGTGSETIAPNVAKMLGYDTGKAIAWNGEDNTAWIGYDFRWERGNDFIRDIQYHRPDICLPSSGRQLKRSYGIGKFQIQGQNLFYKAYLFDEGPMTTHVFQIVSEDQLDGLEDSMVSEENSRPYRIKRVLEGRRVYPGRQVINLYLRGVGSAGEATEAVRRLLETIVVPVK